MKTYLVLDYINYIYIAGAIFVSLIVFIKFQRVIRKLRKIQEELGETKTVFEIKVRARTRELEELAKSLDEQVQKRTGELRDKIEELERFNRLAVGRELKMIELKEKIESPRFRGRIKELEKKGGGLGGLEDSQKALINILEDVEEARKKVEEEKNKTLSIITNFSDGLLAINGEDKISLVNPVAEVFLGVKKEEIIDRSPAELAGFPPLEPLTKILNQATEEIFRQEIIMDKDLVLEVSKVPLLDKKEKAGSLIILHNITREKTIETMKTEFVSLAAHQLRTPLSAIKWTILMFLDGDLGETTAEQKDFLGRIYISNERMIALINDLLDVARIEEGKYVYDLVITDIEPIVESEMDNYKDESEKRGVKLIFEKFKDKLPKVMVETEKIRLVIRNLIDNAIKYTNAGGSVRISARSVDNQVEVSVEDTGVGIPKNEQGRIFSKFFRGFKPTRMETVGSGLGLFLIKNIIEAHKGKIWFKSEEGKGTTFYFALPAAEEFAEFLKKF